MPPQSPLRKIARFSMTSASAMALAPLALVLGVTALAAPASALPPAADIDLMPHRAVYDMSLADSKSGSGVSGIRGRMVFEFTGSACDGYTMNMRLVTQVTDRSGRASTTDLRSSSWEEGDGGLFRFNSTQYQNEAVKEVTRGSAARAPADRRVKVTLKKPTPSELTLGGKILFPTQHSLAILTAAQSGRSMVQASVYDGSEKGAKVYATTAFIGKAMPPGTREDLERVKDDKVLDALPSWPISISYFDQHTPDSTIPAYELNFRLYSNGISRKLLIDYGDFAVRGSLRSLETFEPVKCE